MKYTNSQFIKNMMFIGRHFFKIKTTKKLINFNMSAFARNLEVSSQAIKLWINGGKISKIALERISKRISTLMLGINITPDILLHEDIEQLYFSKKDEPVNIIKDDQSIFNIDTAIRRLLFRYPEAQTAIFNMVVAYDIKAKEDISQFLINYLNQYPELKSVVYNYLVAYHKKSTSL